MPRQPIERRPRREEGRWSRPRPNPPRQTRARSPTVMRSPRRFRLPSYDVLLADSRWTISRPTVGVVLVIVQLVAALWIVIAIADPLLMVLAARTGRGGDRERAERLRRQTLLVSAAIFFGSVVVMWPIFL